MVSVFRRSGYGVCSFRALPFPVQVKSVNCLHFKADYSSEIVVNCLQYGPFSSVGTSMYRSSPQTFGCLRLWDLTMPQTIFSDKKNDKILCKMISLSLIVLWRVRSHIVSSYVKGEGEGCWCWWCIVVICVVVETNNPTLRNRSQCFEL